MKTILIAILAVLSVVLVGVSAYQRSNQPPEPMPIVLNQPATNQLPANQLPENKQCVKDGEIGSWRSFENRVCCSGLKLLYPAEWIGADEVCYSSGGDPDRMVSCNCGDGICGSRESECTCPQDCGEPAFVKNNFRKIVNKNAGPWQTYKNEQYGFEIKYPPGAVLATTTEYTGANRVVSVSGCVVGCEGSHNDWDLSVDVVEVSSSTTFQQWWDKDKCQPGGPMCFEVNYKEAELNGYPAFSAQLPFGGYGELSVSHIAYYFLRDNRVYSIITNPFWQENETRIDQMLSTLKFIK